MQVLSAPSEHNSNSPSSLLPTPGPETLSDPALSLREAALLTLKSKRRKPNWGLSHRSFPDDASCRLDYGQAHETTPPATTPPITPTPPLPILAPRNLEVEDGQIREEGEISDTEGTSPVTAQPSVHLELEPTPDFATFPPAVDQVRPGLNSA